MIRPTLLGLLLCGLATAQTTDDKDFVEHIGEIVPARSGLPVRLRPDETIATKQSFKPPVEIRVEAKTDSTNLRLSYAADQLIFNWERARNELRVDGGGVYSAHGSTVTVKSIKVRPLPATAK